MRWKKNMWMVAAVALVTAAPGAWAQGGGGASEDTVHHRLPTAQTLTVPVDTSATVPLVPMKPPTPSEASPKSQLDSVLNSVSHATANTAPTTEPELPIHFGTVNVDRVVAVVGDQPILWSAVLERVNQKRAMEHLQVPDDSAGQMALARDVLDNLIDEELLVQKAQDFKIEVPDDELAPDVDARIKMLRASYQYDAEYRTALKNSGFGSPDDYRRWMMDQARRYQLQQRVVDSLQKTGKYVKVGVSEAEIDSVYERRKMELGMRPATITFRQLVIPPRPSPAAKAAAKAKADSVLAELKKIGADQNIEAFEEVAKHESMDPGTREVGGDLGWNRRGVMVPEFEGWMFALRPGTLSPHIETVFGYHIIRVDRIRPAEVKASHILIRWKIDDSRVAAARVEADSVLEAWKAGANFDSLVIHHHDPREEKGVLQPYPRDSLPASYLTAFRGKTAGDFVGPFSIEDKSENSVKFVVAQILSAEPGGPYSLADVHDRIRETLSAEAAIRRLLDEFRKESYVSIRL